MVMERRVVICSDREVRKDILEKHHINISNERDQRSFYCEDAERVH